MTNIQSDNLTAVNFSLVESYEILTVPDPRLKVKAEPVTEKDRVLLPKIIPALFATMYQAKGIGLAATQVGLPLRIFVIDLQEDDVKDPRVFINPQILDLSEETDIREEGCLSVPKQYEDVERPVEVRLAFEDLNGNPQEITATGLLGVCIQHEYDHLNGILFVDHLSALKRRMLVKRVIKEKRLKEKDRKDRGISGTEEEETPSEADDRRVIG